VGSINDYAKKMCEMFGEPDRNTVMNAGLCIPTHNAGFYLGRQLPALSRIRELFHRVLIVDSGSQDGTVEHFRAEGYEVQGIPASEFDHGGTRQMAVEQMSDCDIVVFLTQDAIPVSLEATRPLLAAFDDPEVAIAYGRQLPRPEAGPIEAHARLFGYPATSRIKSKASIPELGLRSAVVSNSFAAYRRDILIKLGGFPKKVLFGEDTLVGAKAILAGWKIAYVGSAEVYHSHNYSLVQEFRRYFDNGAFYSREKWILNSFGKAEGSGVGYVLSEVNFLLKKAPWLLPISLVTVFFKYFGYKTGSVEKYIPLTCKKILSMNRLFWSK